MLFQLFGQQLFSIKAVTSENQKKYPSLFYTIYFLVVFVVLTGLMLIFASYATAEEISEKLTAKTVLNNIVQHSMYFGLVFIIWVSLIQTYLATPLVKKFFLNCIQIAKMSEQDFGHRIDHRKIRRKVFQFFLSLFLIFFTLQNILYFYESSYEDSDSFLRICIAIVPMIFLLTTAFKFIFYVKLINFHLEVVLTLIKEIMNPLGFKFIGNLSVYVRAVKPKQSRDRDLQLKIRNLRKIYNVIFENSVLINRAMGSTILAVTVVMVIVITASGYRLFLAIVRKLPTEKIGGKV